MFRINKINSTSKPEKFESLNNGFWYYNTDIKPVSSINPFTKKPLTVYNYIQVRINGNPTVSNCYEALLKEYINEDGITLAEILNSPIKTDIDKELADNIYETIQIDFGIKALPSELDIEKRKIIKAISNYDISPEVNSFFLNGLQVWLDKSTRVGLMNSLNIEKASGKETSTLWFGSIKLNINPDAAIQMLSTLELYALECYNKTAEHKVNVENLNSIEEVSNYNYTIGYPEKLSFNI